MIHLLRKIISENYKNVIFKIIGNVGGQEIRVFRGQFTIRKNIRILCRTYLTLEARGQRGFQFPLKYAIR